MMIVFMKYKILYYRNIGKILVIGLCYKCIVEVVMIVLARSDGELNESCGSGGGRRGWIWEREWRGIIGRICL